jgi:hypothetical protein
MGRKSASGSGIRDEQPRSYFLELRNHFFVFFGLKYVNSLMRIRDPGSGMETVRIRDPGWIKVGSGIRDKHPGSASLKSVGRHSYSPLQDCGLLLCSHVTVRLLHLLP